MVVSLDMKFAVEGVSPGDQDPVVVLDEIAYCGVRPEGILLSFRYPCPLHVLHAQSHWVILVACLSEFWKMSTCHGSK